MEWQSLTDRLRRMGLQIGLEKPLTNNTSIKKPIESVVSGRELHTPFGTIFSADHFYPKDYCHGRQAIVPKHALSGISQWIKASHIKSEDLNDIVFLDTETTGLSGGTGTMAFMVGVARYRGEMLKMEQFFLKGPAEEAALLTCLSEFCDSSCAVVTYNGKSFDIPILNSRFVLQGFESPFVSLPHFDLLHLSRRVWKARLEQCTLGNIEQQVLGVERLSTEVPGYLIPEFYTQYLRNGDADPLKGIFYHNEVDVLSLVALFSLLADILENPSDWHNESHQDLTALGKVLERMGNTDMASELYQRGSMVGDPIMQHLEPLMCQAALLKKRGDLERSAYLYQLAADQQSMDALVELAKYYEHKLKRPQSALVCVDNALDILRNNPQVTEKGKFFKSLMHRRERLLTKIRPSQ